MNSKNVIIFGDSVTWGRGLPARVGWANLLRNDLETRSIGKWSLYDLGIDGDTSKNVLDRFDIESAARNPALILFAVGVNDSAYRRSKDQPIIDTDTYNRNMRTLFHKAVALVGKNNVYAIAPIKGSDEFTMPLPDSTTGKCYKKERVTEYANLLNRICQEEEAGYVRLSTVITDVDFYDGLHPNIEGHRKIYNEIVSRISFA